ncbi:M56 family metallopeptidase [uncultured Dokdonia sp.]|uniref:M56 family metallopeptidase n=1 Tax=uncultured Dokdonia sp. TaxID=575653 RepID=UPI0026371C48|nr:M56 family metallopeptidase [uncultured Dokdonia sp.]
METLILLAKSASILGLFYVIYLTVLYKNTLFTAKRHYFIAGIIAAITLPFIEFTREIEVIIPSQALVMPALDISSVNTAPIALTPQPVEQAINWWQVLVIIYITGICIMLCRLCTQYISLRQLIASGSRSTKGRYTFVAVTKAISPFSFFSKIVYNPALHTPEELEMIIAHEKVHAQQRHSLDMLLSQITLVIQWCNPFAWMYKNSLEQNLEYLADHQAIQEIKNPKQYQRTLVQVSSPSFAPALTNQFYQSFIKKRIVMINTPQSHKNNLWRLSLIIPVLALFMYSFNVKEVTNYVEEDNTAFAKAEKDTTYANQGRDVFFIDSNTTPAKLDRIEAYVSNHWENVAIKFNKRKFNAKNTLTGFFLQAKFENQEAFTNKFSFNAKENTSWEGYSLMVNTEQEIVVMEQKDGTFINITPDKTIITDEKVAVNTEKTAAKENNTTKDALGPNPVIVVNNNVILGQEKEKRVTGDSITSLPPAQAIKAYGTIAQDGALIVHSSPKADTTRVVSRIVQETYNYIITKNTLDWEIDGLSKVMREKHNATLKVSGIKRNKSQEITSIVINLIDDKGNNKNYTLQTPNPINDIYIYKDENGFTGMGNINMDKSSKASYDNLRAQMEERRKALLSNRDSLRAGMEVRKQELRARMDERRKLQGRAQSDSMRQYIMARRDSMKMQMKEQREGIKSKRKKLKKTAKNNKAGYVTLENGTYYYVETPDGSRNFYNRWGVQIQESDALYKELVNAKESTAEDKSKEESKTLSREEDMIKRGGLDKAIYYINDKEASKEMIDALDPTFIKSVTIYKGEKAIKLYGKKGKNGVIQIDTTY